MASETSDTARMQYEVCAPTAQELDELSARHPQGSMQQTSYMMALVSRRGSIVETVGIRQGDKLVSGCFILYSRGHFGLEASVWNGPMCDYHDAELARVTMRAVCDAAKRKGAISVTCWPNVNYRMHDSEGDPQGTPDDVTVDTLKKLGWRHAGFTVGYGAVENRWNYVKDLTGLLDEKSLLASYAKNTRRNVRIAANSCVEVRQITREELPIFRDICELSCIKQGFANRDLSYFQDTFDCYGDHARFMVAEIHLDRYLETWQDKLDAANAEIARLEEKQSQGELGDKALKRLEMAGRDATAAANRIAKAREYVAQDGDVVPVAAALFIDDPHELVYLMSGSNGKYAKFYAPTALQHEAMLWCVNHGLNRYNFYGISGYFNGPEDPGHGVLEFKQGFEGHVEELVGEFTYELNPLICLVQRFAHKLLRR